MGEIYLSNELVSSTRKGRILELLKQGPARGTISLILHEAGKFCGDITHIDPYWVYDYGTDLSRVEAIVETIDRHICNGFSLGGRHYGIATIKVSDNSVASIPEIRFRNGVDSSVSIRMVSAGGDTQHAAHDGD